MTDSILVPRALAEQFVGKYLPPNSAVEQLYALLAQPDTESNPAECSEGTVIYLAGDTVQLGDLTGPYLEVGDRMFTRPAPAGAVDELQVAVGEWVEMEKRIRSSPTPPHTDYWHQSQWNAENKIREAYAKLNGAPK